MCEKGETPIVTDVDATINLEIGIAATESFKTGSVKLTRAPSAMPDYDRLKKQNGSCFYDSYEKNVVSRHAFIAHLVKHRAYIAAMVCAVIHNMPDHIGICRPERSHARMRNGDRTFRVLQFF